MGKLIVLSIAGFDESGGAGLQADLKTFFAYDVHGLGIITSLTAQDTQKVNARYDIKSSFIKKELKILLKDIDIDSIKLGMLANKKIIKVIVKSLKDKNIPIVLDPVILSTSGFLLLDKDAVKTLKKYLLPITTIITPNIQEAEFLTDKKIKSIKDMKKSAKKLYKTGVKTVLIKGGHLSGKMAIDLLYNGKKFYIFKQKKVKITKNVRGTGCTLSSAIAANMAKGYSIEQSVKKAKKYITKAIKKSYAISKNGSMYLKHGVKV